jgi:toxin-antitoxin system PIN domain toxin
MFLLDVNVWIALAFATHDHHKVANDWLNSVPNGLFFFCRLTQQGFLRLATDTRVLKSAAITLPEAWRAYDAIFCDARVTFSSEPLGVEAIWREYTQGQTFTPKVWNDAFLAAFARAGAYDVVTLDQGFRRYPHVKCTILS